MGVMDEQPPGQPVPMPNPVQAILAKIFGIGGPGNPTAGMPPQGGSSSTAAVTPLAGLAGPGMGTPPPNMPPGVPGVPPTNMPPGAAGPNTRPMPSPNGMTGGSYSYPNKQARNAAVVSTGVENVSEAIHNFRAKKDQDEYQRAKNTMDMYNKAAAINPETGLPQDPHLKDLYENDNKIVKSWEKYLKLEFPREAGPPDPKTGKPTQGKPIIPQPQAPAAEQSKALVDQRQLQQLRNAPGETGHLTPEESHKKEMIDAGITPSAKDTKATEKIDAEIAELKAKKEQSEADVKRLDAETARLGPNDPLRLAQIKAERALAIERLAQANKDAREAGKSKTLQEFTVGRASIKEVLTQQSKALTKLQSQAMAERSKIGKAFGSTPDPTPEQDAQQERVSSLNDAYTSYIGMQDDVTSGRISPTDAMLKARRSANLDSDFNMWSGVPQDAPQSPPKEAPEGSALQGEDGTVIAVKQGNKWVAP
jgi:hypothetical protein